LNDGAVLVDLVDGRIVRRRTPYQHGRITNCRQLAQNLRQVIRTDLASSSAAGCHLGQRNLFVHGCAQEMFLSMRNRA
jgi:hypothetical protein